MLSFASSSVSVRDSKHGDNLKKFGSPYNGSYGSKSNPSAIPSKQKCSDTAASKRTKTTAPESTIYERRLVFIPDPIHDFVPAELIEMNNEKGEALVEVVYPPSWESATVISKAKHSGKEKPLLQSTQHRVPIAKVFYQNKTHQADMRNLVHLNPATMLYNLKERHYEGLPYTNCLSVLVAMNPFEIPPNIYSYSNQHLYAQHFVWNRRRKAKKLPPHVYQVSSDAYYNLATSQKEGDGTLRNQTVLVSGESGAGKSETVKLVLSHLAMIENTLHSDNLNSGDPVACSSNAQSAECVSATVQRILESSPILEAFGNAKTLRNKNSSRFGKFIQLQFSIEPNEKSGSTSGGPSLCRMKGSKSSTYLLEKSRAVSHAPAERNFHVFYQLLAAREEFLKDIWPSSNSDLSPDSFKYLAQGSADDDLDDSSTWETTCSALEAFEFHGESLIDLMRALAFVLQLGNLQFADDPSSEEESTVITTIPELGQLSEMSGIDPRQLEKAFTVRIMKTAFDEVAVTLRPTAARDACDALAKETYARIFDVLVSRINDFTQCQQDERVTVGTIAILDIFGFEKFDKNSFEQLCINYANERLQFQYIQHFCVVPEEFKGLGKDSFDLTHIDNSTVLALLDGKNGILDTLNEECITPNGSDEGYVLKIKRAYSRNKKFADERLHRKTEFGIHHFAGLVTYDATKFIDKNNDNLPLGLMQCISKSTNKLIREEFETLLAERRNADKKPGGAGRKKKANTSVVQKFRFQLQDLMLSMEGTDTRFIRCIKPNESMTPRVTDQFNTLRQLKCAGLVAAIDVSRYRELQIGGLVKAKAAVTIQSHCRRVQARKLVHDMRRNILAIRIQAEARRFLALIRVARRRRETAAQRIQAAVRKKQAIEKVQAVRLDRASVIIQSRVRIWKALKTVHAMRRLRAVIRVQSCMRSYWAIRLLRKYKLERSSAVRIQSQVRRRKWTKYLAATRQLRAATVIQTWLRQHFAVALVSQKRCNRCAAFCIQKQVRGYHARKVFRARRRHRAATVIQASVRRHIASRSVISLRRHGAALLIQKYSRRYQAIRLLTRRISAAIRIQTFSRGAYALRVVRVMGKERASAIIIQRQIKLTLRRRSQAASYIQSHFRSHLATKHKAATAIQKLWTDYSTEKKKLRLSAAVLIQNRVRMHNAQQYVLLLRHTQAANVIQTHVRSLLAIKLQAVAVVQRHWYAYVLRKQLLELQSAVLIQTQFRICNAKGLLQLLRQHHAANTIQVQIRHRHATKNNATILIQSRVRMYNAKILVHHLRRHQTACIIQAHILRRLTAKKEVAEVQKLWTAYRAENRHRRDHAARVIQIQYRHHLAFKEAAVVDHHRDLDGEDSAADLIAAISLLEAVQAEEPPSHAVNTLGVHDDSVQNETLSFVGNPLLSTAETTYGTEGFPYSCAEENTRSGRDNPSPPTSPPMTMTTPATVEESERWGRGEEHAVVMRSSRTKVRRRNLLRSWLSIASCYSSDAVQDSAGRPDHHGGCSDHTWD